MSEPTKLERAKMIADEIEERWSKLREFADVYPEISMRDRVSVRRLESANADAAHDLAQIVQLLHSENA